MCKAPKPPKPKEPKKPQFLRNKYLDEFVGESSAVRSLKAGRDSLRIPLSGPDVSGSGTGTLDTVTSGPTPIAPRVAVGGTNRNQPGDRFSRDIRR